MANLIEFELFLMRRLNTAGKSSKSVETVPRLRKYDAIRRVKFILSPKQVEEMERAKGRKAWGEFIWELWEFWKLHHSES